MKSIPFPKRYLSTIQIVELLKNRGLTFQNEETASTKIQNIGYYRFSAYLYPFLMLPKDRQLFKGGSLFENALSIYYFDHELRSLIFHEIAKIEVAVRSAMANIVAEESGNIFWTTDAEIFANQECYQKTMSIIDKELRNSKEEFIEHFKRKYSDPYPPAWMLLEILPLGTLNYMYNNIANHALRKKIAARFSLPVPVFSSWLTIIALTRNACCHHARVWNKENAILPIEPKKLKHPWINTSITQKRIFYDLCIIKFFVDIISPENDMKQRLEKILEKYPTIDVRAMGFSSSSWKDEPLWR